MTIPFFGEADMADNYNNYIGRGWTRHEAFDDILRRNPPRKTYRPGDIVVLNVSFNYRGNTYCYISEDDVYKPGDLVEVRVRGETKVVTVESVGYYSESEFPFRGVGLNTVIGPATGDLAEKYREVIAAEKKRDDDAEQIRAEAKVMLEEAKRMKADANAELERANKLMETAVRQIKEVQLVREEAEKARLAVIQANKELIERALSGLERRMTKVRDKAEQLASADDTSEYVLNTIRKLDEEYLPKTTAMIAHYRDIFSEVIPAENVEQLRSDALEAIDKSNEVYDNILASLFERDMLELYSEMKALQTMFAIAGLTNSDFNVKL